MPPGQNPGPDIVLEDVVIDEFEVIHSLYTDKQLVKWRGFIQNSGIAIGYP